MMGVPLAIVVWLIAPDPYEVAAWLHVGDPQNIGGALNRNASEYDQFRKTQAALIKSPLVLRAALELPGIAELPVLREKREPQKYLEDEVAVVAPMDQELLQIKMRGKDAQQLVKIVNAVKQSYLEHIVQADYYNKLRSRELIETSYKETMDQMQKKRELLDRLLRQYNAPDLEQVKIQRAVVDGTLQRIVAANDGNPGGIVEHSRENRRPQRARFHVQRTVGTPGRFGFGAGSDTQRAEPTDRAI